MLHCKQDRLLSGPGNMRMKVGWGFNVRYGKQGKKTVEPSFCGQGAPIAIMN